MTPKQYRDKLTKKKTKPVNHLIAGQEQNRIRNVQKTLHK